MRLFLPAVLMLLTLPFSAGAAEDERERAFRPLLPGPVPRPRDTAWPRNPVDAFVRVTLEKQGLSPAAAAPRRVLARRLYLDLLGLPPTPEQLDRFLSDPLPGAWSRLVDRLLASPAYGQRWAQHWLDVVRYADSDGFEYDDPRPHAWRYRDWVIESLNQDKPFQRFVLEQIAADELFPQQPRSLAALGLHRLGPLRLNAGQQDEAKNRQERLTEIVDVVSSAFLGVTFSCARCHDHKFDPFPQADYYRLQSFFAASEAVDIPLVPPAERKDRAAARQEWTKQRDELRSQVERIEKPVREQLLAHRRSRLSDATREALETEASQRTADQSRLAAMAERRLQLSEADVQAAIPDGLREKFSDLQVQMRLLLRSEPPAVASLMVILDRGRQVPATHLLIRGEPHDRGREVFPAFPTIMVHVGTSPRPREIPGRKRPAIDEIGKEDARMSSGRRAVLAGWLAGRTNPLTARVFVNRLWQHHFGQGIVATPNDFGSMGASASHPDLLDWLAAELVSAGGSVKHVHRLMLLSATYRQSSQVDNPQGRQTDPDNIFLWRARRQRLEAEPLRDSLLAVSGQLNQQANGPGVRLPLPLEIAALQYKGNWQAHPDPFQHNRRTIFLFVKRNNRPPLLLDFDAPGTMVSCARRNQSSHAGQALTLLNSPELDRLARAFAQRLQAEVGRAPVAVVERAYRLALGRAPRPDELSLGRAFLEEPGVSFEDTLSDFCLVLFNLDEFLYVE